MTYSLRISIFSILAFSTFNISCISKDDKPETTEPVQTETKEIPATQDELDVKATIDSLLVAAGNYNLEDLDRMVFDKSNLGITSLKDGQWQNTIITVSEYIESVKKRKASPYCEIIYDSSIQVSEGQLAFAKADNIVYRLGIPLTREINYFTLLKDQNRWKFLNIAFTVIPVAEAEKTFNLEIFTKSYAQSWGSKRPEFVASYFAEDGALQVNDGAPAKGREAIAKVAQGFMTDLPDMQVSFDSLVEKPNGKAFYWTLTATNSGPGGTGNKVKVSGYELWQLSENGLIQSSEGHFPTEEYNRQLKFGVDK